MNMENKSMKLNHKIKKKNKPKISKIIELELLDYYKEPTKKSTANMVIKKKGGRSYVIKRGFNEFSLMRHFFMSCICRYSILYMLSCIKKYHTHTYENYLTFISEIPVLISTEIL